MYDPLETTQKLVQRGELVWQNDHSKWLRELAGEWICIAIKRPLIVLVFSGYCSPAGSVNFLTNGRVGEIDRALLHMEFAAQEWQSFMFIISRIVHTTDCLSNLQRSLRLGVFLYFAYCQSIMLWQANGSWPLYAFKFHIRFIPQQQMYITINLTTN